MNKIHSVNGMHIIEKSGKRPFRVTINGRGRAFASIEAAVAAKETSLNEARDRAIVQAESWHRTVA